VWSVRRELCQGHADLHEGRRDEVAEHPQAGPARRASSSLQLVGVAGATYVATAVDYGGKKVADSLTLRYNSNGTWLLA